MSMSAYSPEFLANLTTGELADFLYNDLDIDPDVKHPNTAALVAEIARRGLKDFQLHEAWEKLRDAASAPHARAA
jgi:hypothetical protein